MAKSNLRHFLARHRRSRLLRRLDWYMVLLHEAYENRNYDFDTNGERMVLEKISSRGTVGTVFDVGGNTGEWSRIATGIFPQAGIHAFEIVDTTYRKLVDNCRAFGNIRPVNLGLSDEVGEVDIYCNSDADCLATSVEGITESHHGLVTTRVRRPVTTGDRYCAEHRIKEIDFLKVDVEGMEDRVLRGFAGMLKQGAIKVLQFEYGYVNAATKFLLRDFYELLRPYDMVIGKIYPTYVDFREYRLTHEDFLGPNFLAVHPSCSTIIDVLRE